MKAALAIVVAAGCGRVGFEETQVVARCPVGPDPGWTLATGYRAVVITDTLDAPSAVTYAGDDFGGRLFVAQSGDGSVRAFDPATGAAETFVAAAAWPVAPMSMTALIWDDGGVFDGSLYLADRGTSNDDDSTIYAIDSAGATRVVATAPGPALDDVYSLAFVDAPGYGTGLFVTGDTDGDTDDWARYTAAGGGTPFSRVAGVSGIAVDRDGAFDGGVYAARPANTSFAGDDSIVKMSDAGEIQYTLAAALDDVHAAAFAPRGPLFGSLYAARSNAIVRVASTGEVATIVRDVAFDTLDGNVLAFAPGGNTMYVVSRADNMLACLETTADPPGSLPPPPPPVGGIVGD